MVEKKTVSMKDLFAYTPEKKPLILSHIIEGKDIYDSIMGAYPEDCQIFEMMVQQVAKIPSHKITKDMVKKAIVGYLMEKYKKELPEVIELAMKNFFKEQYTL